MKLAVVGKDDLETLEKWARDKFAKVPIRTEGAPEVGPNGVRVVFEDQPIGEERMGVSDLFSRCWTGLPKGKGSADVRRSSLPSLCAKGEG